MDRSPVPLEDTLVPERSTALVADFFPNFGMRFLVGFEPLGRSEHLLALVTRVLVGFAQVDHIFVLSEEVPAVESRSTESADVLLGEAIVPVPHEAGRIFERFQATGAHVFVVGSFGFVFAPLSGMVIYAVGQQKILTDEFFRTFCQATVESVLQWWNAICI